MINLNWIGIGLAVFLVSLALMYKFKSPKNRKQKLTVELVEATEQTHDTKVFTFLLPDPSKKLGLKIG